MAQRHQRGLTLTERRLIRRILIVLTIVAVAWFVFAPNRGLIQYHRLQKQVDTLARENKVLAERNDELHLEIERLRTDDAYLEELARQKYDLLRENETVYEFKPSRK
mgnify:CR=1 FL=1